MAITRRELSEIEYLEAATELLQRHRTEHPTSGVWEAADLQWWWRRPRRTDAWPTPFWFDDDGPVAAAVATDWDRTVAIDCLVVEGHGQMFGAVWEAAIGIIEREPMTTFEVMVDDGDDGIASMLTEAGFARLPDTGVAAWGRAADMRLTPVDLPDGYHVSSRADQADTPHHFSAVNGPTVEERLRQTGLYRDDLDLVVVTDDREVVAYGLFWNDPTTGVGFIEPIGTVEVHRRKGLARAVVVAGLRALVDAGATRLKVNYEGANAAAKRLYLGAGFVPTMTTSLWVRRPERTETYG